jgi:hypothetical protein
MAMGYLSVRRSKKVGPFRFFLGKRGVTTSTKVGPLSVSSTGRSSIRLGPGLRWNFGRRRRR